MSTDEGPPEGATVTPISPAGRRRNAAQARRRARERQIITATRALFDARGVRDAQIEDVARAVGVNRAIIYRHFSGKEELFALTVVDYLDELLAALAEVDGGLAPRDRLAELTRRFVDYCLGHPAFVDCAQALMRRSGPELLDEISESALFRLGRSISACLRCVTDTLAAGNATGDFAVDDVDELANLLYATSLGALQLARVGMLVKEAAPGVPAVAPLGQDQVREALVTAALALARPPRAEP